MRLKGGDPLLFGRAQEEIDALEAAGIAVRSRSGHHRGARLCRRLSVRRCRNAARCAASRFATPRVGEGEDTSDWARGFASADAGAIYMGIGEAAAVAAALLRRRQAGIASGGDRRERVAPRASAVVYTTLAELPGIDATQFPGPTLLLIGPQFVDRRAAALDLATIETLLRRAHG